MTLVTSFLVQKMIWKFFGKLMEYFELQKDAGIFKN